MRESVVANFATTAADEKTYQVDYYNLDVIISVGYRVKSERGTQFRIWAINILKELLDRIRDIRSSEKVMYRQALDLYATSVDYNPKSSGLIMWSILIM